MFSSPFKTSFATSVMLAVFSAPASWFGFAFSQILSKSSWDILFSPSPTMAVWTSDLNWFWASVTEIALFISDNKLVSSLSEALYSAIKASFLSACSWSSLIFSCSLSTSPSKPFMVSSVNCSPETFDASTSLYSSCIKPFNFSLSIFPSLSIYIYLWAAVPAFITPSSWRELLTFWEILLYLFTVWIGMPNKILQVRSSTISDVILLLPDK